MPSTEKEVEAQKDNYAALDEALKNFKLPDVDDHNRTMVLQIDRTDLRLISPDRKVILLHKHHRDVTTCVQGLINAEHFGFICREGNNINTYIGYVFKCESPSVANEAVGGKFFTSNVRLNISFLLPQLSLKLSIILNQDYKDQQ